MNRTPLLLAVVCLLVQMACFSAKVQAQAGTPRTDPGVIEKSLRKSRPEFQPPKEDEAPQIGIEDSRKLIDPGAGPVFPIKRIIVTGNTLVDDQTLAEIVQVGDEGMEMTLGILTLMANEITALYASRGYLLTRAYIPQQEIEDGVVEIRVVEGRIGQIEVKGNERFDAEDYVWRMDRVQKESVTKEQTLERTLLELNDLMGVEVKSVLRPGELPGTSDLVLEVTESRPWTASFDADNFGSRFTGESRFGTSATVGNVLMLGDQFSGRWVRSDQGQNFFEPTLWIPLTPWGTQFKFDFIFAEHELGENLSSLRAGGKSEIYTFELIQALLRSRTSRLDLRAGVEFRTYENEQLGDNTSKDSLHDWYATLGGNFSDKFRGRTFWDVRFQFGFHETDNSRGLISRADGQGDVILANLNVTRYQSAGFWNSYFILKVSGQITSERVLSPDLYSVGGVGTVRGYPLSEFSGDDGANLSLEYVIPFPWEFPKKLGLPDLRQVVTFNGFIDHGQVFIKERQPGEQDEAITGVGGGFKINVPSKSPVLPSASFGLSYGIPVFSGPDPSDTSFGTVYLSGIISY